MDTIDVEMCNQRIGGMNWKIYIQSNCFLLNFHAILAQIVDVPMNSAAVRQNSMANSATQFGIKQRN